MEYNIDYFIKKFEAIPEEQWTDCGLFVDPNDDTKRCALGHCRASMSTAVYQIPEADALDDIFLSRYLKITSVNDYKHGMFQQDTPKQRILFALNYFKSKGNE